MKSLSRAEGEDVFACTKFHELKKNHLHEFQNHELAWHLEGVDEDHELEGAEGKYEHENEDA